MGVTTGVDVSVLLSAAEEIGKKIGHAPPSRYLKATRATEERKAKEHA